jgi:hypothetical protein
MLTATMKKASSKAAILMSFASASRKDGYSATVRAASLRRDFGNRSVVMTAIVKVPIERTCAQRRTRCKNSRRNTVRMNARSAGKLDIKHSIKDLFYGGVLLRRCDSNPTQRMRSSCDGRSSPLRVITTIKMDKVELSPQGFTSFNSVEPPDFASGGITARVELDCHCRAK